MVHETDERYATARPHYKWWFGWAAIAALGMVVWFFAAGISLWSTFQSMEKESSPQAVANSDSFRIFMTTSIIGGLMFCAAVVGAVGTVRCAWYFESPRVAVPAFSRLAIRHL